METSVISGLRLVGGDLALDFVNTRSGPPTLDTGPTAISSASSRTTREASPSESELAPVLEGLSSYDDVVTWAQRVGVLSAAEARTVRAAAAADARGSRRAFTRALALREALTCVFVPLARNGGPDRAALAAVSGLVSGAIAHGGLAPSGPVFTWQWTQGAELEAPLWPVAFAAGVLLGSPRLARLKGCPGCSFVFVDESKNGSRRWCSMEDCGRAAKIRSYVERRADRRRAATNLQP